MRFIEYQSNQKRLRSIRRHLVGLRMPRALDENLMARLNDQHVADIWA